MKIMKKVSLALAAMMLFASAAFASGQSTSVTFSVPTNITTTKITGEIAGYDVSSTTKENFNFIGFGICSMNNNIYSSVDFSFPGKYKVGNATLTMENFRAMKAMPWFMNFLGGPAFRIIDSGIMELVLAPGIHFSMNSWMGENANARLYYFIGLGGDAMFNYYFTSSLCVTAAFSFGYDFFGFDFDSLGRSSSSGLKYKYSNMTVTPRIGVGYSY